jgi:hypothetical protein
MYQLSADFSGWFRLKCKSRKTFDIIMSTKSVLFSLLLWEMASAQRQPPHPRASVTARVTCVFAQVN